jgi:hypothetical protein
MRTPLCDSLGIELPIFAFTHWSTSWHRRCFVGCRRGARGSQWTERRHRWRGSTATPSCAVTAASEASFARAWGTFRSPSS